MKKNPPRPFRGLDFVRYGGYNIAMNANPRKRPGPKPKPDAERQSHLVGVRLTPADFRQLAQDAAKAKLSLSAFMADCWRRQREA